MNTGLSSQRPDVVILCGGLGTRLRPALAPNTPKALAPVGTEPFLEILIRSCAAFGLRRFILCTGWGSEAVRNTFSRRSDNNTYVFSQESEPLGTAGAVKHAQAHIESRHFFVMNGDSLSQVNMNDLFAFHICSAAAVTITLCSRAVETSDTGIVSIDGGGRVTSFEEKPMQNGAAFVNAGVYVFSREAVFTIPADKVPCSLEKEVFPSLIGKGLFGYVTSGGFHDIGTPERYRDFIQKDKRSIQ